MKRMFAVLCAVFAMAAVASAATYNGVQTISTPIDQLNSTTTIGNTGTDTVVTVTSGGALFNTKTFGLSVGQNTGTVATLNIDAGGTVGDDGLTYPREYVFVSENGTGTLNINGGTLYGQGVYLGFKAGSGPAVLTMSSGLLDVADKVYIGYFTDGTATFSGGTANLVGDVYVGYNTTGRLNVVGSAAAIACGGQLNMDNDGTMGFTLNSSTGHISCINANSTSLTGGTIDMALDGYVPTFGQVFDLVKDLDGTISITSLSLAAEDVGSWELQTNGSDTLQAKYVAVPEPATAALLGLGVIGLVTKHRRGRD